jgi:hypothetical protein
MSYFQQGIIEKIAGKKKESKRATTFKSQGPSKPKHLKLPDLDLPTMQTPEESWGQLSEVTMAPPASFSDVSPEDAQALLMQMYQQQ